MYFVKKINNYCYFIFRSGMPAGDVDGTGIPSIRISDLKSCHGNLQVVPVNAAQNSFADPCADRF